MDDEKIQKELFPFETQKRSFPRLSQLLPKPNLDGKRTLTVTLEAAILIIIGIVLVTVIMFAFGVERGRTIKGIAVAKGAQPLAVKNAQLSQQSAVVKPAAPGTMANTAPIKSTPNATIKMAVMQTPSGPEVVSDKKGLGSKNPILNELANPWTIVVLACKNKDIAISEVIGLKKQGASATANSFIVQNGPYYLVCIGAYKTKASAEAVLVTLRQKYKDAYIKLQ